ncbi:hypothetical protein [Halosimplex rubrum]|nr:hypothetical protein [Halosimplex rubrum]
MISWQPRSARNNRPMNWPDEDEDLPTMEDYLEATEGDDEA